MRLSPEIFDAMDNANEDAIRLVALLGAANRQGLFTTKKPFELSVNINGNALEITSLSCHGITKSGCVVDIEYDSYCSNTSDTRVIIPSSTDCEAYYLVVRVQDDNWREINEIYSELAYSFELFGANSIIPDNCLTIGMLVNQYGWRMNETDFVPPCLYVSSHQKFINQLERAKSYAEDIFSKCMASQLCVAKSFLSEMWKASSLVRSRLGMERDILTPGQLFSIIQQFTSSFMVGCFADEYISLDNQDPFVSYSQMTCDAKNIYNDIEIGLSLCAQISLKMDAVCSMIKNLEPVADKPAATPVVQHVPEPKPGRNRWDGIEI